LHLQFTPLRVNHVALTLVSRWTVDEVRPDRVYDSELHSEILVFLNQGGFIPLKWALIGGFIQGTLPLQIVSLDAVGVNNATERELVIVILHSTLLNTL